MEEGPQDSDGEYSGPEIDHPHMRSSMDSERGIPFLSEIHSPTATQPGNISGGQPTHMKTKMNINFYICSSPCQAGVTRHKLGYQAVTHTPDLLLDCSGVADIGCT